MKFPIGTRVMTPVGIPGSVAGFDSALNKYIIVVENGTLGTFFEDEIYEIDPL